VNDLTASAGISSSKQSHGLVRVRRDSKRPESFTLTPGREANRSLSWDDTAVCTVAYPYIAAAAAAFMEASAAAECAVQRKIAKYSRLEDKRIFHL